MDGSRTQTRPQRSDYRTAAEYRWARRNWRRAHGGSLIVTLAIAFVFGAWTGSQTLLWDAGRVRGRRARHRPPLLTAKSLDWPLPADLGPGPSAWPTLAGLCLEATTGIEPV